MARTTQNTMILCDTNILIEFYKGNPDIIETFQKIGSNRIAISIITEAELYRGAINKNELRKISKHLDKIHQISLNQAISKQFIHLINTYSLSHRPSIPDSLIAATALVENIPLYTLNRRDFHYISNLELYSNT